MKQGVVVNLTQCTGWDRVGNLADLCNWHAWKVWRSGESKFRLSEPASCFYKLSDLWKMFILPKLVKKLPVEYSIYAIVCKLEKKLIISWRHDCHAPLTFGEDILPMGTTVNIANCQRDTFEAVSLHNSQLPCWFFQLHWAAIVFKTSNISSLFQKHIKNYFHHAVTSGLKLYSLILCNWPFSVK